MKKRITILMSAVVLMVTAMIANERTIYADVNGDGKVNTADVVEVYNFILNMRTANSVTISDFPDRGWIDDETIGTPDAGKTAWAEGDVVNISLDSPAFGTKAYALTYDGEKWNADSLVDFTYMVNEDYTVSAAYAPAGVVGLGEYLIADCAIQDNQLLISFESVERTYSRLRIVAEAGQLLVVTTTGFTPAGATEEAIEAFTLTADEKGNAYLYGTFVGGAKMIVKNGDITLVENTFETPTEPGKSYALYAGKKVNVDLSTLAATYVINDDAYYTFTGTGSYGIKVESGNPRIILNNVNITVGEEYDFENVVNAIDIVADNSETTVWITGTNNLTSNSGAGIYVKSGSTVIIKSDSRDNILTARAGMDGAGIGGTGYDFSYENVTCGNIYIENITVNAYSSGYMSSNPGIGAITSCGTITIKNATVTALGSNQGGVLYGGEFCPAIGASTVPDIVIENSTINAYRGDSKDGGTGSLADWIGAVIIYDPYSGDTPHTPGIQCGNGYIISTTVNKFLYKASSGVTTEEGSVTYDADGNPTEQTAE